MNAPYAGIHDVVDPLFGKIGTFDDWGFPESAGREAFNFDHIDGYGPITLIQNEVTQLPAGPPNGGPAGSRSLSDLRLTSSSRSTLSGFPTSRDDLEGAHHFVIFMIEEMTVIDKLTRYIEVGNDLDHRTRRDTDHVPASVFVRGKPLRAGKNNFAA